MEGIAVEASRPEEGQKGLGFGHRRGGTGRASYRRPPEGSHLRNFPEGKRGASATSKAPGAKRKVESMRDKGAKRAASGKLHIDDGCMGGGKGNIPYKPTIFGEEPYRDDPKFHSGSRHNIFHYTVYCDEIFPPHYAGEAYPGGLSFVVSDSGHKTNTFIHELGHNILGDNSTKAPYGAQRDGHGHHKYKWWQSKDCAMYKDDCSAYDYCSDCWEDINLAYCYSNYAGNI